ncbi:N-6 DNA methylase, partial [Staphylococcus aureus]
MGQYFTPRNVVQSMVRMSKASTLQDNARICDPFCGVGGFLLETIVENKDNIWRQFRPKNGKINPRITLR